KVPRPPNAFILYRQKHHPDLKKANPHLHNNEISVILGRQWQNESETVKESWKAKAMEVKTEHLARHPGYHYQPR
ncbi:mating-type protein MAT1-2, partial [Rhizodiscina lignyota]